MPRARKTLVSISDTHYYHVVSRCVRRGFLCGHDLESGRSYEHRREWIEKRIHLLTSLFAIDVAAYAVMSNHYHIVLKLTPEESDDWSLNDILLRWTSLFRGPLIVQKQMQNEPLTGAELQQIEEMAEIYRKRLCDLSWFMKCLNEPIARQANEEDQCTGHFWESRFKSQALRTEEALLSCMAYVDLNPVRSGIAETPEDSDFTSIKYRLVDNPEYSDGSNRPFKTMMHFKSPGKNTEYDQIPIEFRDYLELVDLTGRAVNPRKRGAIAENIPPILERLGISYSDWITQSTQFEEQHRKKRARKAASHAA